MYKCTTHLSKNSLQNVFSIYQETKESLQKQIRVLRRKQLPVGLDGDDLAGLAAPVKEFPTIDGTGKKGSPQAMYILLKQIDQRPTNRVHKQNEIVVAKCFNIEWKLIE